MNFLKRGLVCILLCFLFVICCCSNVLATSASINVTESNGPVTVNASATFTAYEECDDEDPPNCTTNNSGTLKVYQDGNLLKSVSGEGTASWSTVLDGAAMANGDYNFRAVAVDSQGDSQSMEASLTIDNTPQLSAQLPEVLTGPLEIPGTAVFKECLGGNDGRISFYINDALQISQSFDQPNVSFSYTEIAGAPLEVANRSNGDCVIKVVATAANGATDRVEQSYVIDNPISVTAGGPGKPTGPVDISGTARFIEYGAGNEGTIIIDYYPPSSTGYLKLAEKTYDSPTVNYSITDMLEGGKLLDVARWYNGVTSIKVTAYAANNHRKTATFNMEIENPISVTADGPSKPTGPVDISGIAEFIEYDAGNEGTIIIDYKPPNSTGYWNLAEKTYDSPTVNYSITDMLEGGKLLDVARWYNGVTSIKVTAYAANNHRKTATFNIEIENPISITAGAPSKPTGPIDISGIAEFIEYDAGNEGTIIIDYKHPNSTGYWNLAEKTYDSPTVNYSITDMLEGGKLLDVARWYNGVTNIKVIAKAANGGRKSATFDIEIENPISVTAGAPSKPTGPVDISGIAKFIEYDAGKDGTITIEYKPPNSTSYWELAEKTYDSPTVNYSIRDMLEGGKLLDVAKWYNGVTNIKVIAKAANGGRKSAIFDMEIKNPIDLTVNAPEIANGPLDVTGTSLFIDSLGETDGTITIGHDNTNDITVSYDHPSVNFSYSQMAGTMLDTARWSNGSHNIFVKAQAPNNGTLRVNKNISVDNTPQLFLSGPKKVDHEFDIACNAVFKEYLAGYEGVIYMKLDDRTTSGAKVYTCVDSVVTVNYSDLAGAKLDARDLTPGEHTMYAIAKARNGSWTPWQEFKFTVVPYDENNPVGSGNIRDKIE